MTLLYHGSTEEVSSPSIRLGRAKVDFGQGFYLTKLERQASLWARTLAERRPDGVPILNAYEFDRATAKAISGSRYKIFDSYDIEWLEYVIDCRRGGKLQRQYDVVEGGVANDRVIDTVEDFEKGIITAEQALGQLAHKSVNHQTAILSQSILARCLKFKTSRALPPEEAADAR